MKKQDIVYKILDQQAATTVVSAEIKQATEPIANGEEAPAMPIEKPESIEFEAPMEQLV